MADEIKQNVSVTDLIEELSKRENLKILFPTIGEVEMFPLTTEQQQNLVIAMTKDNSLFTEFYKELNAVIMMNVRGITDVKQFINSVTTYDRDVVALQLSIEGVSKYYKYEDPEDENKIKKFDLSKIKIKKKTFKNYIIDADGYKVTVGAPILADDELFNSILEDTGDDLNFEKYTELMLDASYVKIAQHMISVEVPSKNYLFDCRQDPQATMVLLKKLESKVFSEIYQKVQKEYIDPKNELLETSDGDPIDIRSLFTLQTFE